MRNLLSNKPLLIAIAAVVILGILALSSSADRMLTWVESTAGSVMQPVQTFASGSSNAIIRFVQDLFNTTDADKENQQLKIRIAQLEQYEAELQQLKSENRRLKELLNYAETIGEDEFITANVIGKNQGVWFNSFTLNAGRNHGVKKDMPVVNNMGLVGRVTDVGATWCKVRGLIDAKMNVSCLVERTRDNGMIRGTISPDNKSGMLELYYLPAGSDLVPGDKIITNGIGGIYPKNIMLGTVIEVTRTVEGEKTDHNAVVQASVDFTKLDEVMIITGIPEVSAAEE
ncbi:MAG: Cell shape-determining protein MreC precursor [Firmicutes bacterium ADurb.Bin182]|nr:MAG: Cell shape-determining protein MreC precursor [Firmicutes bacterium ADurb.Bin182]